MTHDETGKILWVNLSSGELREEASARYREWIGGRGLGSYLLARHQPSANPTPEQELIVVAAGALTATAVPLATRTAVVARNRLSGGFSYSNVGGDFGIRLRMSGYDAIAISGASPAPVYLLLQNGTAELVDARALAGLLISDLRQALHQAHGAQTTSFLGIGPAGEREVAISCLMADAAHAAGWGGSGAIFGAKNLKAVVASGDQPVPVFDEARLMGKGQQLHWRIGASEAAAGLTRGGTHGMAGAGGFSGMVPTGVKNLQDEYLPPGESASISESTFRQWQVDRAGCTGCSIRCLHIYDLDSERYGRVVSEGMHANSVRGLASNWEVDDPDDLLMAHTLCNEYGLDVDGVSSAIAFALESAERGVLPEDQEGGVRLAWGDGPSLVKLVRQIGEAAGLGRLLGQGAYQTAEVLGQGSHEWAMTVKRVGVNEQGLRSHKAWSLGVMTATRGGGHLGGSPQSENRRFSPEVGQRLFGNPKAGDPAAYEGKGELVARTEALKCIVDSLGLCYFIYGWYDPSFGNPDELAEMLRLATGWHLSGQDLLQFGHRCHTLERYLSWQWGGYSRVDDTLPDRFFLTIVSSGPYQGAHLDREQVEMMLDEYYATLGWDVDTGLPTEAQLRELGLDFLVEA